MKWTTSTVSNKMCSKRVGLGVLCLLVASLVVASCGSGTPLSELQVSPLSQSSPLPTTTASPTDTPTPVPTPEPRQLVVLHTNDNWGETEPCG